MSLKISNFYHQSLLSTPQSGAQRKFSIPRHRGWKRRKLKLKSTQNLSLTIRCHFNYNFLDSSPFENLFQSLISQFSSANSLHLLAPALGLASGAAIFFSQFSEKSELMRIPRKHRNNKFVGDWILFTSPTPFNRFVVLRCPSISVEGSELLEDVNEKLMKEDRHFVRLNSGRIQVKEGDVEEAEKLVYQRVCVGTEDGGVLSLDWPANLDLEEERGLDTTILIVPGTAEGSMEKDIREFVCECLRRGCFPVVMNPRGCAGSPLTTPRLFTAADSDDISTAIQFINKARPWTTMMAVGWGYGANMLTKYLAEIGEKTPLTAATCIDNPFDLEEVTRSTPYHILLDQKLKTGLIDILRSNKELFQGRAKGFNVKKALLSTSVRDFEKAISMVSYGFAEIEDFYAKSSTRDMVGKVKIPLLFIQNDNGTVPIFSTPRSLIAENPFTSLLLCSYLPSKEITGSKSTVSWCQHLTIEWLAAVELGLLKGRHPLLKDVDVTINPSKGLTLAESRALHQNGRVNKLLNVPNFDALGVHSLNLAKNIFEAGDTRAKIYSRSKQESKGLRPDKDSLGQSSSIDAQLVREEVTNPDDGEMGQVLQTAKVVMNMLDATMPNTLTEEQKKKVLSAVGQGETLINALQGAVPEDVRGKLTTAVSGILHSDPNIKIDRLLSLGRIPDKASRLKSKVEEKTGQPSTDNGNEDPQPSAQSQRTDDFADVSKISKDKTSVGPESEPQASEYGQQSANSNHLPMTNGNAGEILDSDKKATNDLGNHMENMDSSRDRTGLGSDSLVNGSETVSKPELPGRSEGTVNAEDMVIEQHKENDSGKGQSSMKGESSSEEDSVKAAESSHLDQTISMPATQTEDRSSAPVPMSESQIQEKEGDSSLKREENSVQGGSAEYDSKLPSFDVSQAFDAFTGIDDSTQVAVNSVFNVIEDMITQLEGGRENGDGAKDSTDENQKRENIGYEPKERGETQDPTAQNQFTGDDHKLEKQEENRNEKSIPCDSSFGIHTSKEFTSNDHSGRDPATSSGTDTNLSWETHSESYKREGNGRIKDLPTRKLSTESLVRYLNVIYQPNLLSVTTNLYGDHLYKEVFQKYLMSKKSNTKTLDMDTTATLFLDYSPEEGKWKLLEEPQNNSDNIHGDITDVKGETEAETNFSTDVDSIIEPSYVIFDSDRQEERVEKCKKTHTRVGIGDDNLEELLLLIKGIILDALKLEVERRVSDKDIEEMQPKLAKDLELVANSVCLSVGHDEQVFIMRGKDLTLDKFGTLEGQHIIRAITSAVQETSYLGRVLPVGVIVGSTLAALRNYFDVAALNGNSQNEHLILDQVEKSRNINHTRLTMKEADKMVSGKIYEKDDWDSSVDKCSQSSAINSSNGNTVMIGAVTAALGASALLVEQKSSGTTETLLKPLEEQDGHFKGPNNEEMSEKTQNNIVTSLAEKALLVAAPMVPTKEGGGVDHERLVAMLTELGQKGGILKLVGKIALLWGGIRGALSLTDKLISFLHVAERPLFQRISGFVLMVLVLWSPVVVPLLPTLVQSWATHNSPRIAELACLVGLCVSIMLMVTLWGKRIRGYDNPLEQYGLDLTSPSKVQHFAYGLIWGVILVLLIHYANFVSGFVHPSMPTYLSSSSSDAVTWLKVCGRLLWLVFRGLATATGVAIVEELLFRSWLPDEIAADCGYYPGVIISGLAFSLSQRSPWAIPGLWLLSLGLAGARQRSQGSLSLPIGLRAGIIVSSFILQRGGFLTYSPSLPNWLCGSHPFEPFSGIVGIAFSLALAIILYPRQPLLRKKSGAIREFSEGTARER
ncbi:unnamed protein product [Coffea canephora]|uniref:AB hydrolase-1 domain-containing protein n=1 Tax=Coffea canephora TaxID=49390 RepID=A0A068U3X7_COFCA|nr:unnamed protein product [Coffea canephora]